MDWPNEPYVRVYTRDTDDDLALSWEARALWDRLMRKFDRSGFIETKRGARGLAAIALQPLPVVERVLPELLADGRLVAVEGGFVAPNYVDAQTASKSDRLRQQEARDRRRSQKLDRPITNRDATVTKRDENIASVTLCSAVLCDPELAPARDAVRPEPSGKEISPPIAKSADQIRSLRALGDQGLDSLNAIRARVAQKFGWNDVRPLHPMDACRTDLSARLSEAGDRAPEQLAHVLRIAELEAIAKRTVEYLGGGIFKSGSWSKKLAMREADAVRAIGKQQTEPAKSARIRVDEDAPPPMGTSVRRDARPAPPTREADE
jgi:hypothetical protein